MLDSQIKKLVELYYSMELPEFDQESTVEQVRSLITRFSRPSLVESEKSGEIKEHRVPTSFGDIGIRGYYPPNKKELAPILYFRSSGFVVDNLKDSDAFCMRLAEATETFVLSVDYPLAPEFPFPSSLEACYQVYLWALEHTDFSNLDTSKVVVMGESSGGCLVANLAQLIRDKGTTPPGYQVLLYPITDSDLETSSYKRLDTGYILTRKKLEWYLSQYLGVLENKDQPYAFPMNMEDLTQLPKTLILTAEFDPLVDDGFKYSNKLKQAGNECEYLCFSGMIHGFLKFNDIKRTEEAFLALSNRIKNFLVAK